MLEISCWEQERNPIIARIVHVLQFSQRKFNEATTFACQVQIALKESGINENWFADLSKWSVNDTKHFPNQYTIGWSWIIVNATWVLSSKEFHFFAFVDFLCGIHTLVSKVGNQGRSFQYRSMCSVFIHNDYRNDFCIASALLTGKWFCVGMDFLDLSVKTCHPQW